MSALSGIDRLRNVARALAGHPEPVYAHCDIPCGIYDPHEAQIAALTVIRMDQLIGELPAATGTPAEAHSVASKLARYTAVKEQHAERVKHEIRVIYGDYITADHLTAFLQLSELTYKIFKQASKARQGTQITDAQELLKLVQEFAEIFWKTKNVTTHRVPSQQKPGGELVVPA